MSLCRVQLTGETPIKSSCELFTVHFKYLLYFPSFAVKSQTIMDNQVEYLQPSWMVCVFLKMFHSGMFLLLCLSIISPCTVPPTGFQLWVKTWKKGKKLHQDHRLHYTSVCLWITIVSSLASACSYSIADVLVGKQQMIVFHREA